MSSPVEVDDRTIFGAVGLVAGFCAWLFKRVDSRHITEAVERGRREERDSTISRNMQRTLDTIHTVTAQHQMALDRIADLLEEVLDRRVIKTRKNHEHHPP